MSSIAVARGVAGRSLLLIPRLPSTFIPSLVMPVFFTIVFAGGFSGVTKMPGFPAKEAIDWFLPMSALMGAGFAGITTGMGVARDLEIGFYDRLLVSPAPRWSLIAGTIGASIARATLPITLVMIVGTLMGASFVGGTVAIAVLILTALGVASITGAWSLAIALRLKTLQSAPLMQTGLFLTMFLSTAQMPLHLIKGWLHEVARFNPMTRILDMARQGFLGDGSLSWTVTWQGIAALGGLLAVLLLFAGRSMQKVTP